MEVNKKALNEDLLIWRGFTYATGVWSYPDGETVDGDVPYFPESFDDCLEWILPCLALYQVVLFTHKGVDGYCVQLIFLSKNPNRVGMHEKVMGYGETLTLALCLAIKKVINETSS